MNYPGKNLILANYKLPLLKVPESEGSGFYGALSVTSDKSQVQCHICGKLFANLGRHVWRHGIKPDQYREQFKLARTTSLCSEIEREKLKKMGFANWGKLTKKQQEAFKASGTRGLERLQTAKNGYSHRLEIKNKRGVCPDQILERITALKNRLGRTPKLKEFVKDTRELGQGGMYWSLRNTFGSWNKALEMLNLPTTTTKPTTYSKEQLLEFLISHYKRTGNIPTTSDAERGYIPSPSFYLRQLGGMRKARRAAGIE